MSPHATWTPPPGAARHENGFYSQTLVRGDLVVGRVIQPQPRLMRDNRYTTETFGIQDAILCIVHLRHMRPGHTFWDGRHLPTSEMFEGSLHLHDQRYNWTSELTDAFESVHFSFPQALLSRLLLEDRSETRIELAAITYDVERRDETMLHLSRALLPALSRPREVNRLFADHVIYAAASHIASRYGSISVERRRKGGLSSWQIARVTDYIVANLSQDISIGDLAAVCRLSPDHFAHAFSVSMGEPPHRFLLSQRIERSLELLANTHLTLSDIAIACGFADQSHFSRVFRQRVGITAGRWRRQASS